MRPKAHGRYDYVPLRGRANWYSLSLDADTARPHRVGDWYMLDAFTERELIGEATTRLTEAEGHSPEGGFGPPDIAQLLRDLLARIACGISSALRHIAKHRDQIWLTTPGAIARHCMALPEGVVP